MINNADEVEDFLENNQQPTVIHASTIKDGYVSCINPIPTICGAELHVNTKTRPELMELMRQLTKQTN